MELGVWSLAPLIVALVFSFKTRSAAFSLFAGVLVGVVLMGDDPVRGMNALVQNSLGNADFLWLCEIIIFIGILFELFKESGVIAAFAKRVSRAGSSAKRVKFTSWAMGFVIVDDYFSPLMTGAIMRPLSDAARISREKLAFILDSTTASVCILVPFTAWGAYLVSLIVAQGGPVTNISEGMDLFVHSIPYNFYSIMLVVFTLGICLQFIPDFGPMRRAEIRARETGQVIREGGVPLISDEGDTLTRSKEHTVNLLSDLLLPVLIVFGVAVGSFVYAQSILTAEAFMLAVFYLGGSMLFKKQLDGAAHLSEVAMRGVKNVMPAIIIVALANCINTITTELGAANFIISSTQSLLTPGLLVAITFLLTATISFSTGTSWGAYALMIPLALPLAYNFSGGTVDLLVLKTVAAVAGGGIFGDHASPVSDTSVLSSAGAGSDHMDHVVTQLPYALVVAGLTCVAYLLV